MTAIPYRITPDGISFVYKGSPRNILKTNPNFTQIKKAVIEGLGDVVETLTDIRKFISKISKGNIFISDDEVHFKNEKVPEYLAQRILQHVKDNDPIDSVCKFAEKLMENPDKRIVDQLFKWLEVGNMPLFDDGDILAYKMIQKDYYSHASGTDGNKVFQGVGETVSLDREACDSNPNQPCSTGLHFCSFDYLPQYGSGQHSDNRVVILKIHPKNVVAIPNDYGMTKGRCCEFTVIGEVPEGELTHIFKDMNVVSSYGNYNTPEPELEVVEDKPNFNYGYDTENNDSWDGTEEEYHEAEQTNLSTENIYDTEKNHSTEMVYFKSSDGRQFTSEQIIDAIEHYGMSNAALTFDIPRSTLRGWYKKATI